MLIRWRVIDAFFIWLFYFEFVLAKLVRRLLSRIELFSSLFLSPLFLVVLLLPICPIYYYLISPHIFLTIFVRPLVQPVLFDFVIVVLFEFGVTIRWFLRLQVGKIVRNGVVAINSILVIQAVHINRRIFVYPPRVFLHWLKTRRFWHAGRRYWLTLVRVVVHLYIPKS